MSNPLIYSGLQELDQTTGGFNGGELIFIAGRPGTGKTMLACRIAIYNAAICQKPVGFFSLERHKSSLEKRFLSFNPKRELPSLPIIIEDKAGMDITTLESKAKSMIQVNRIKALFIDYLGLIEYENKVLPKHKQIVEVCQRLKALVVDINIPVFLLGQLNRDTENRKPTLNDIMESSAIQNFADAILLLNHEHIGEGKNFVIAKNRSKHV